MRAAYGPKVAMNWAFGICRHWRAKNAFSRSKFAAWRGAKMASGHSRHTHGRAGQGFPAGPCRPDSGSVQEATNTSWLPETSAPAVAASSPSPASEAGSAAASSASWVPDSTTGGAARRTMSP